MREPTTTPETGDSGDEHTTTDTPTDAPGAFYLGRGHDLDTGATDGDRLEYPSRDLTTHAVCVGMTGSGKTGLCVGLLEEAGLDGVPAIVIDPKGDIPNLLLTFPELRGEDFEPWVDDGEAERKGQTVPEFAASRAALWRKGLGDWGIEGDRIARFRDRVDLTVYTPGSSAGVGLSPLRSLSAPSEAVREDGEALRERVSASVSGLLSMLGVESDPLTGREHIFLSTIVEGAWSAGESLDLAGLIGAVQAPGFDRVGVLALDEFMPARARSDLAMRLNTLLASPGFRSWLEGEPLDIGAMLRTKEGKPRISIVSIAHLSERERMFVVTLLLGELVAWVRTQPGSSSLRALLYMDEVFGYFPPVANPPSKRPMLTLLKQARAHGLGVVLATQNPVDLDYKGLSNTGTWFLGRLQTERDKARVMEGLEGAGDGGGFDRDEMERLLAGLGQRVFLMHSVHEKKPTVFHTRWVMSYLRGPVTRAHIKTLMAEKRAAADSDDAGSEPPEAASDRGRVAASARVPAGPAGVDVSFVDAEPPRDDVTFRANVLGSGSLHFVRVAAGIDVWEDVRLVAPMDGGDAAWESASKMSADSELLDEAPDGAVFATPSAGLGTAKLFSAWRKAFISHAYRHEARELWHCKALKTYSELGEREGAFRERLASLAAQERAEDERKVRARFARRLDAARERVRKAEARVERETAQYRQSGLQAVLSFVVTIIGALLGRKKVSATNARRAGSAVGRAGRTSKEKGDISRAKDSLEAAQTRLSALEEEEAAALDAAAHGGELVLTRIVVRPRKGDLSSSQASLVWVADGALERR